MNYTHIFPLMHKFVTILEKNPRVDEVWIEIHPTITQCFPRFASDKSVEWRIKRSRFDMLKEEVRKQCSLTDEELDNQDIKGLDFFWDHIFSVNEARIRGVELYIAREKKFDQFVRDFNMAREGKIEMTIEVFREYIEELNDHYEEIMDKNTEPSFIKYYEVVYQLLQSIRRWSLTLSSVKDLQIMSPKDAMEYIKVNYPEIGKLMDNALRLSFMFSSMADSKPAAVSSELTEPPFDD